MLAHPGVPCHLPSRNRYEATLTPDPRRGRRVPPRRDRAPDARPGTPIRPASVPAPEYSRDGLFSPVAPPFRARPHPRSPIWARDTAESPRCLRALAAPTANLPEAHRAGAVFGLRSPRSAPTGRNIDEKCEFIDESGSPHTEPRWKGECEGKGGVVPLTLASGGVACPGMERGRSRHSAGDARSLASRPILDPPYPPCPSQVRRRVRPRVTGDRGGAR